jgi:hypothetical protein
MISSARAALPRDWSANHIANMGDRLRLTLARRVIPPPPCRTLRLKGGLPGQRGGSHSARSTYWKNAAHRNRRALMVLIRRFFNWACDAHNNIDPERTDAECG